MNASAARQSRPAPKQGKKKGSGKSIFWRVIFWVALVVFIVAAGTLAYYAYSYWHQQAQYDEIAEENVQFTEKEFSIYTATMDWDNLRQTNSECIAWVYVPDTVVNYPICHTTNDTKYLTVSFNGVYDQVTYGTIFLEAANQPDFSDMNNFIFGHNMGNGGMLALVNKMHSQAEFDAHRTFYLLTPNGNLKLRAFSIINIDATEVSVLAENFATASEQAIYVQDKINRSLVQVTDCPDASQIGKTFAFITCDSGADNAGRYLLYCYVEESTIPTISPVATATDTSAAA